MGERKRVSIYVSAYTSIGKKRVRTKAREGRGRRVVKWVQPLERELMGDFERFRRLGMKMLSSVLRIMAKRLIEKTTKDVYNSRTKDDGSSKKIATHVDCSWVQRFMCRNNIALRRQNGKLAV